MYPITLTQKLDDIEICGMKLRDLPHPDFKYPWEIIDWHCRAINQNAKIKIQNETSKFKNYKKTEGVYRGQEVKIEEYVVFDTTAGSIVVDDNAHIYPFTYIEGPCYIGAHTEIKPHAQIRKNTSIGHHCKIGGEVSGSIFQPYTNKAHHGFVGDSYIGSWVNLGAGTTTSNLKNTYGPIRVEYDGETHDTGMQFFGCVLGDYVKTAINSAIYTGKIIGVYAQLFGFISENVGSFVMDLREGKREFELDAAIRAQKRMFERRGKEQGEEDIALLKRVFNDTAHERKELI